MISVSTATPQCLRAGFSRRAWLHCAEGAIFAAAALAYHGKPPLLMDIRALPSDQDHIITLFQERGLWGAISKTNHAILRWRDPIYLSVRELAMTYAHSIACPAARNRCCLFRSRFRSRATRRAAG